MRCRNIKPGFFTNEQLGECHPLARLLFAGLWCVADREGRLEDRPRRLKTALLPYDECDIEELLNQLAIRGFIVRYEAEGQKIIQVIKFAVHQKPYCREQPSKLPPPTAATGPGHSPDKAVPQHEKDSAKALNGQCHSSSDSCLLITDPSSLNIDSAASQPFPPSAEQPMTLEEEMVERKKNKAAKKAPKEREPDPLFDVLVDLTGSDPHTSAPHVAKVAKALRAADPPYSPEEIKRLPEVLARDMPYLTGRLTLGTVQKYAGLLRAKPSPTGATNGKHNPARRPGPGHRFRDNGGGSD